MQAKSGVYIIFQRSTLRAYVGSSQNVQTRVGQHQRALRQNKHHSKFLQRAWNKHGECDFGFLPLEYCGRDLRIEREQFWMDFVKPEFNSNPIAASSEGHVHSPETCTQMSVTHTQRYKDNPELNEIQRQLQIERMKSLEARENLRQKSTGRVVTQETKDQISESLTKTIADNPELREQRKQNGLGRKHTEESKELMRQSATGRKMSEEAKENLRELNTGKTLSEEHKRKTSESMKAYWANKKKQEEDN